MKATQNVLIFFFFFLIFKWHSMLNTSFCTKGMLQLKWKYFVQQTNNNAL